jgi:hypothetical protein
MLTTRTTTSHGNFARPGPSRVGGRKDCASGGQGLRPKHPEMNLRRPGLRRPDPGPEPSSGRRLDQPSRIKPYADHRPGPPP